MSGDGEGEDDRAGTAANGSRERLYDRLEETQDRTIAPQQGSAAPVGTGSPYTGGKLSEEELDRLAQITRRRRERTVEREGGVPLDVVNSWGRPFLRSEQAADILEDVHRHSPGIVEEYTYNVAATFQVMTALKDAEIQGIGDVSDVDTLRETVHNLNSAYGEDIQPEDVLLSPEWYREFEESRHWTPRQTVNALKAAAQDTAYGEAGRVGPEEFLAYVDDQFGDEYSPIVAASKAAYNDIVAGE